MDKTNLYDIIPHILGDLSLLDYLVGFLFGFIGALPVFIQRYKARNKYLTPNKVVVQHPPKFSFRYFFLDNLMKLIMGVVMMYIALRFVFDFFGFSFSPFYALMLGYAINSGIVSISILEYKAKTLFPFGKELKQDEDEEPTSEK